MELSARFRELPAWAAVLSVLLGILVAMTALSMVLGVVFAGIAVGIELGSAVLGIIAVLLGLGIVLVPAVALVTLLSNDDGDAGDDDVHPGDACDDRVASLRREYMRGEIDEEHFERRLDALLAEKPSERASDQSMTDTPVDENSPIEESEY